MIVTLPNVLSLIRLPLALLFIKQDLMQRVLVVIAAMLTDGLDGFIARKWSLSTKIGRLLDPITDRFFVFVVIGVLCYEGELAMWKVMAMVCRDVSVLLFGLYLVACRKLWTYRFGAIWCGKITTFLQFIVVLALIFHVVLPARIFSVFLFFWSSIASGALSKSLFSRSRAL